MKEKAPDAVSNNSDQERNVKQIYGLMINNPI